MRRATTGKDFPNVYIEAKQPTVKGLAQTFYRDVRFAPVARGGHVFDAEYLVRVEQ